MRGESVTLEKRMTDAASMGSEYAASVKRYLASIRPGDRVTILVPAGRGMHGQEWKNATGRAVIISPGYVALNMGGRFGTPGVATAENLVSVRKTRQ
jgi:hypothetical protein